MNRKSLPYFSCLILVGLLSLWGCPKKAEVTSSPETQMENAGSPAASGAETKAAESNADKKSEGMNEKAGMTAEGLKPIYFDFDKSFIREDARDTMKANADWLKANLKAKIKIEGNCDERGTKEYNQALGQRRAQSAKKYLTDLGVSGHRISLMSYGKEKPVCNEHDETCWQKNRRDDLVVESQ
jgi:peptidoglycan-associated lipoprotein